MNITRNLLHEWYHGGARTPADVRHLAAERLGLQLTAEKVDNILRDQIPLEQWYQTRIMQVIKAAYPDAFVRKISAGVYSEKGFPDILVIIDGRYYGIEAKRPFIGKPSPNQVATILKSERPGALQILRVSRTKHWRSSKMEQNAIDTLWNAAQCAVQRMVDFFRRISELLKEISWKIVRAYASNMAFYFNLATDRQISLMYHKRARTRKKWYKIILRRIRRFMKERLPA